MPGRVQSDPNIAAATNRAARLDSVTIGHQAGSLAVTRRSVFVGFKAQSLTGRNVTPNPLGYNVDSVIVGCNAIAGFASGGGGLPAISAISIGCGGTGLGPDARQAGSVAIGSGAEAVAGPKSQGAASTAIGSVASSGVGPVATGDGSVALGGASGSAAGPVASGSPSIAIGGGTSTAGASATSTNCIAIGLGSSASALSCIALGRSTSASANGACAIGTDSGGSGASTAVANEIKVGTANHTLNVIGNAAIAGSGKTIALFGGTARTQPTRAGQLTDNSGGTSGGATIAAIAGAVDPTAATVASTANAIATLAAKINAIEDKLSGAGTGIGVTA